MKIKRLSAKNFGKFEDYSVDLTGNIAVVSGQNEAGKTTIFDMIKILLFGLDDAKTNQDRTRYIRYGQKEAFISGEFEKADGTPIGMTRRITKDICELNISQNFEMQNLGDVKAPIVSHLTKEVYENIYALDFHTMSAIRDDVWQGIKDEFMGADMSRELISANDAISSAQKQADQLYKASGTPSVLGDLQKEYSSQNKQYETLRDNQRQAADSYLDLEKSNKEVLQLQNQIEFEGAFLSEAEKMNSLKEEISRIRELAQQSGDLSMYKKWLPNIKEQYDKLKCEAISTKELFEQAKKIANEDDVFVASDVPSFDERYQKTLDNKEVIEKLRYQKADSQANEQSNYLRDEHNAAKADWHTLLREILVIDADEDKTKQSLDDINTAALSKKQEEFEQMRNLLNKEIKKSNVPIKRAGRTIFFTITLIVSIVSMLMGGTLLAFDAVKSFMSPVVVTEYWFDFVEMVADLIPLSDLITAESLIGLGVILMLAGFVFIKGKSKKLLFKIRDQKIEVIKNETEELRAAFEELLCGLQFPKLRIKKPDNKIVEDITELKRAKVVLQDAQRKHDEFERSNQDTQMVNDAAVPNNEAIDNLSALLLEEATLDPEQNLIALKNLLKAAETAKAKYDIDMANRPAENISVSPESENHLLDELETKCTEAVYRYDEIASVLGPDADSAIVAIQNRYDKLNKAVVLRDEIMSRYENFKEISARLEQLESSGWPYNRQAVAQAEERIAQIRQQISDIQSKIGVMEDGVKRAVLSEKPQYIASEMAQTQNKIDDKKLEHDKLRISQEIIKLGHDIFSKLHQPEVLSRASYYLSILTGGKYSEMELSKDSSSITIMTEEGVFKTPHAARLSQATCEQIYLSIRLSVIDSFDRDTEIMPITLDEALITWDTDRLTSGLDLLAQIARKRQVMIFTCHNFIVDILKENNPDVQIVKI